VRRRKHVGDYDGMTNDELQDELRERELPVSGNKDELIARLEADDGYGTQEATGRPDTTRPAVGVDSVTVSDSQGRDVKVEVGADGESPVTSENPPAKAIIS
jgi:SAP domain-containing protein